MTRVAAAAGVLVGCFWGMLSSTNTVQAQQAQPSTLSSPSALTAGQDSNALLPLLTLRPRRDQYAASPLWRDDYFEYLAANESFVGNDAEAIADFDAARPPDKNPPGKNPPGKNPPGKVKTDSDADTRLDGCTAVDARQEILALAATHPVIFINEAHHVPMDRAFTLSLLRGLYARGFRYFAAEDLREEDTGLQARGYPTQRYCYYIHEPVYADLIRTALKIGYTVVPYEYEGPRISDPVAYENNRERGQAQNLYERILKHDPNARILVHAGYGHIAKLTTTIDLTPGAITSKSASGKLTMMALWFQQITKIVPLSIDQTVMQEHSASLYENPSYQAALRKGLVQDTPVVLRNKAGRDWVTPDFSGVYDLLVFHPRTQYQFGRPTWLSMNGLRQPYVLPSDLGLPPDASVLAQAFYANEDVTQAIPVDQVEIKPGLNPLPVLLLPTGRFHLRIIEASGKICREWQITTTPEPNVN